VSDPLAPARGIVYGLILGVALWLVVALVWHLVAGSNVMSELGRHAAMGIERDITSCLSMEWKTELCEDLIATWHVDAGVIP